MLVQYVRTVFQKFLFFVQYCRSFEFKYSNIIHLIEQYLITIHYNEDAGWQLVFFLLFTNIMIKAWFKIYPGKKFLKCSRRLGCKTALFWPIDVYELWFKLRFEQNTYLQKITLELYRGKLSSIFFTILLLSTVYALISFLCFQNDKAFLGGEKIILSLRKMIFFHCQQKTLEFLVLWFKKD